MSSEYDSFFNKTSKKYGIDPNVLKSIAQVESSFRPEVIDGTVPSKTGAIGLMQFMPSAAKDYGLMDEEGNDFRTDPEKSIDAAARKLIADAQYFRKKLGADASSDKVNELAIRAYYGGRGNAEKSITAGYANKVLSTLTRTSVASEEEEDKTQDLDTRKIPGFTRPVARPLKEKKDIKGIPGITKPVFKKPKDTPDIDTKSSLAVGTSIQQSKVKPKKLKEEENIDLLKDENFTIIKDYLVSRFGSIENVGLDEKSSKQDYIDKFLSQMRSVEWNTSLGGAPELMFIHNTTNEDIITKVAKGHELYDKLPDFFDRVENAEYGAALKRLGLATGNLLLDPASYVGFGVGSYFKYKLAREGIQGAIKAKVAKVSAKRIEELTKARAKTIERFEKPKLDKAEKLKIQKEVEKDVRDNLKGILSPKAQAVYLGSIAEGTIAAGGSLIDQGIDRQLKRKTAEYDIAKRLANKDINLAQAKKELEQVAEETKIDLRLVGLNAFIGSVAGGLSTLPAVKQVISEQTSKEIMEQSIKANAPNISSSSISIDLKKAESSLAQFLKDDIDKEFAGVEDINFKEVAKKLKLQPKDIDKVKSLKDIKKLGKKTLDDLQKEGILTDPIIKKDLIQRSYRAAFEILINDPASQSDVMGIITKEKKISDVLTDVLTRVETEKIDTDLLEGALNRAGIDVEDFAYANRTSVNEFATGLSNLAKLANGLRKATSLGPEMQKIVDFTFAEQIQKDSVSPLMKAANGIKRLERESKALVVSSIATTVRNVYGSTIGITMDTAARLLDTGFNTSLNVIEGFKSGRYKRNGITKSFQGDMSKALDDSLQQLGFLARTNLFTSVFAPRTQVKIADEFDLLLTDNPRMRNLLLTSLQEVGDQNLSRFSRFANTFNLAQDALFRRGVFVNSVRQQMSKLGMNYNDFIAADKKIPQNILQKASDDALEATFAKVPTVEKITDVKSGEDFGSYLGKLFINVFEGVPGSSLLVPFPRFMANAMAFQYKYSVLQFGKAGSKIYEGMVKRKSARKDLLDRISFNEKLMKDLRAKRDAGEITDELVRVEYNRKRLKNADPKYKEDYLRQLDLAATEDFREGSLALARGTVGAGALYAAYKYRENNQDTDWFNIRTPSGGTVDIRAIFPIAPFLAVADFLVKYKKEGEKTDIKGVAEAVAGIKLQPAPIFPMLESLMSGDALSQDKVFKAVGDSIGDFANRVQQPFQPIYGFVDMIDEEFSKARDPQVTENLTGYNLIAERAYNTFINRGSAAVQELASSVTPKFVKDILNSITPFEIKTKKDLPEAIRFFDPEGPVRGSEFFATLVGFREVPRVNEIEAEFKRLDINPYPVFQNTGDREFDREVIARSLKYIAGDKDQPGIIQSLLFGNLRKSIRYDRMSKAQQRLKLRELFSFAVQKGRNETMASFKYSSDPKKLNSIGLRYYRGLTRDEKTAINELYRKYNDGRSLEEDRAFTDVMRLRALIQVPIQDLRFNESLNK